MLFVLLPILVHSEITGTREVLTQDLAEGQLLQVRYNLTNTYPQYCLT